jgi:hypothetical protein
VFSGERLLSDAGVEGGDQLHAFGRGEALSECSWRRLRVGSGRLLARAVGGRRTGFGAPGGQRACDVSTRLAAGLGTDKRQRPTSQ